MGELSGFAEPAGLAGIAGIDTIIGAAAAVEGIETETVMGADALGRVMVNETGRCSLGLDLGSAAQAERRGSLVLVEAASSADGAWADVSFSETADRLACPIESVGTSLRLA